MAIFTESVCLNWVNESNKFALTFIDNKCEIDDKKHVLDDEKIVKLLNNSWNTIKKNIYNELAKEIDTFYKSKDGSYDYGINTVEKAMKYGKLDEIDTSKFANGTFNIQFCYNTSKSNDKFFAGHMVMADIDITKDYKLINKVNITMNG